MLSNIPGEFRHLGVSSANFSDEMFLYTCPHLNCSFTAWSSAREPSQVFKLLETIYSAFDVIARKNRVLKVETVGYVTADKPFVSVLVKY